MADVIIKGMEMPRGCYSCPIGNHMGLFVVQCPITKSKIDGFTENIRLSDCPLRPAPEWISVEQLQPPTNTAILLLINREFQVVARLRKGEWVLSWNFKPLDLDSTDVLHWMPLQESSIRSDEDGN